MKAREDKAGRPAPSGDNPYLRGRREWMERYGGLVQQARLWRRTAFAALVLALASVIGALSLAHRARWVPYVIEVDTEGRIRGAGIPRPGRAPGPLQTKAYLAHWIEQVRSVWSDGAAQRLAVRRAFASLSRRDPAFAFVSGFCQENWKRAGSESVSVEILGAPLPIAGRSWQVEWRETVHSAGGERLRQEDWKATVEIYPAQPPPGQALLDNPLGLYIRSVDWTRRGGQPHQAP